MLFLFQFLSSNPINYIIEYDKVKCVLGYQGRTGVLFGKNILTGLELYLYITLANVRQVRHSINTIF